MENPSKEEKVARITAKQTIIATIITALSAVGGALIQKYSFTSSESTEDSIVQAWVALKSVDFFDDQSIVDYRVVIDVDGIPFSYPGRAVWKQSGAEPDSQPFPLPIDSDKHNLRFEVFYKERKEDYTSRAALVSNAGVIIYYRKQQVKGDSSVHIDTFPFSGYYDVYESFNGTRSNKPKARVYFEIFRK